MLPSLTGFSTCLLDFNHFLRQPDLIKDHLWHYQEAIEAQVAEHKDIVAQGILLWNSIYEVVAYYQKKYAGEWHFVKHEDLSRNPLTEFKKIFSYAALPFSPRVEAYIEETTTSGKPSSIKRNALHNIFSWKERLSFEEIARIREGTRLVWEKFYTESDW